MLQWIHFLSSILSSELFWLCGEKVYLHGRALIWRIFYVSLNFCASFLHPMSFQLIVTVNGRWSKNGHCHMRATQRLNNEVWPRSHTNPLCPGPQSKLLVGDFCVALQISSISKETFFCNGVITHSKQSCLFFAGSGSIHFCISVFFGSRIWLLCRSSFPSVLSISSTRRLVRCHC